jgi:hypothetical protein
VDPRAPGGLRLVQGRLDQCAARAEREVRLSGRVQDASERGRVPDQLQRERARRVPYLSTHAHAPLYRNSDGTWPKAPEGHLVGDRYVAARSEGQRVQWKRLYRPLELRSEDEVLVLLVAHEVFHYLRKTRQVEGRHGEIEADAFALKLLEQYRDGLDITRASTHGRL